MKDSFTLLIDSYKYWLWLIVFDIQKLLFNAHYKHATQVFINFKRVHKVISASVTLYSELATSDRLIVIFEGITLILKTETWIVKYKEWKRDHLIIQIM